MKSKEELDYIFSTKAIRERSQILFDLCKNGKTHFRYCPEKWEDTVSFVTETIKENYPDLKIPYHSRWGHFSPDNIDRHKLMLEELKNLDPKEIGRREFELVIVSVLLDAGAGKDWKYKTKEGNACNRSEGLAVASFEWIARGLLSTSKESFKIDGESLLNCRESDLEQAFQVTKDNPLIGLEGRVRLLNKLGEILISNNDFFPQKRLGDLFDRLSENSEIEAIEVLHCVLSALGGIWPGRVEYESQNLGDCWKYSPLMSGSAIFDCLVPFHKLSQWLSYSLLEPLENFGIRIKNLNELTGLPEYRNGGLFLDLGLILLRDENDTLKMHNPSDSIIIEWRALTIVLLDELVLKLREKLNLDDISFPLANLLEGGTWRAGRKIAKQLREDGTPPLSIVSDGTVF